MQDKIAVSLCNGKIYKKNPRKINNKFMLLISAKLKKNQKKNQFKTFKTIAMASAHLISFTILLFHKN